MKNIIYTSQDRMTYFIQKTSKKYPDMKLTNNYKSFLKKSFDKNGNPIILQYFSKDPNMHHNQQMVWSMRNKHTNFFDPDAFQKVWAKYPGNTTYIDLSGYEALTPDQKELFYPIYQLEHIIPGTGNNNDPDFKAVFKNNLIYFHVNHLIKFPTESRWYLIQDYIKPLFIDKPVFKQTAKINKHGSIWTHLKRKLRVRDFEILNIWIHGPLGKIIMRDLEKFDNEYPTTRYLKKTPRGDEVYYYNKSCHLDNRQIKTNNNTDKYKLEIKLRNLSKYNPSEFTTHLKIQQMFYDKLYKLLYFKFIDILPFSTIQIFAQALSIPRYTNGIKKSSRAYKQELTNFLLSEKLIKSPDND